MSEFSKDTGLHALQKPKPHDEIRVHIQAAVLSAISHHVLCDYVNESMGMFGGMVDEQQRTIYIEHFYPCHRDTKLLRPDAVEVSDMQVLESSAEFEKYGMKVLGWYHSHPRIKPMPSTKDLNTQLQVQSMIPYAIGIIAGIYSPNTNFGTAPKKYARASDPSHAAISNSYFSFFRALEDDSGKAGVAVNVTIHRSPLWPPWIMQGMCRALRCIVPRRSQPPSGLNDFPSVVLAENQECHDCRMAACRSDEERVLESTSYARVLSLFRISSLFPLKRFLEEQNRQLKWSVGTCLAGAGAVRNVLATGPVAIPPSIVDYRWGVGRPVHYLNQDASNGIASPDRPADEFEIEVDDDSRAKASSSGVKSSGRKRVVSSEESSEELVAPEMPLSATQDTRRPNVMDAASTAEVDAAAAAAIASASSDFDDGSRRQFRTKIRDAPALPPQELQAAPAFVSSRRQRAVPPVDLVVVDD